VKNILFKLTIIAAGALASGCQQTSTPPTANLTLTAGSTSDRSDAKPASNFDEAMYKDSIMLAGSPKDYQFKAVANNLNISTIGGDRRRSG
jgi:hypothetical protein